VDSLKSIKEEEAAEATDDKFVHITRNRRTICTTATMRMATMMNAM
jgi:hypothetical protein